MSNVGVLDEHPAIRYADTEPNDEVMRLASEIRRGATLQPTEPDRWLRAVLDALDVPPASQLLVFSRTGIQRTVTGPERPRAIYFNDTVVVGYIPGARHLEIAAHDARQGVQFYTIDQTAAVPEIVRRTTCLSCHVSSNTLEVPGMIARSMVTGEDGEVLPQLGSYKVDHRSPLSQRWGGWFVTGTYVSPAYAGVAHMGNVTTTPHPRRVGAAAATSNEVFIRWTARDPAPAGYLSADSDIAALLVFDHQMHATNLLTRLQWEARVAQTARGPGAEDRVDELVAELVDYFLFVGEAAPPGEVIPREAFATAFMTRGPRDRHGRSLRELDLQRRLLRYPCSYMIYSPAFDGLPAEVRNAVYERLHAVLSGAVTGPSYAHLSHSDRLAIAEILRDTKPDAEAFRCGLGRCVEIAQPGGSRGRVR